MKLWVRSQNREDLLEATRLIAMDDKVYVVDHGESICVGTYTSSSKALYILDEIQKVNGWLQKDMKDVTFNDVKELRGQLEDYTYILPKYF